MPRTLQDALRNRGLDNGVAKGLIYGSSPFSRATGALILREKFSFGETAQLTCADLLDNTILTAGA